MFTADELKAIAAAHKAVYDAIRSNFGSNSSSQYEDMRAAESVAGQIVAAKIIAGVKKTFVGLIEIDPRQSERQGSDMETYQFVSQALESGALVDDVNANRSAMLAQARNAAENAYCPYSKFPVGAALITMTAGIYVGCNVENVCYNGMSHAELSAISAAITAEGPDMLIHEMVIWTPTSEPVPSCGGCRQLIREHAARGTVVYAFCNDPLVPPLGLSLDELLPHSFGPENLQ